MAVQFISRASPGVIDSATNNYGRSGNHSLQELAVSIVVVQSDELWKSILTVPLFGRQTSGQISFFVYQRAFLIVSPTLVPLIARMIANS